MKEEMEQKSKDIKRKVGWLCVVLVLASMSGGVVLGWWMIQFRDSNKQQWMVPFSLVLTITPIFILISVSISNSRTFMDKNSSSASSFDHDLQDLHITVM